MARRYFWVETGARDNNIKMSFWFSVVECVYNTRNYCGTVGVAKHNYRLLGKSMSVGTSWFDKCMSGIVKEYVSCLRRSCDCLPRTEVFRGHTDQYFFCRHQLLLELIPLVASNSLNALRFPTTTGLGAATARAKSSMPRTVPT